jgi:CRP-like cAMP-binding protein
MVFLSLSPSAIYETLKNAKLCEEEALMTNEPEENLIANAHMIANSPLGRELSESQCQALANKVAVLGMKDGQFLIEEGHKDDTLYVIVSGQAEVVVRSSRDDLVTLHLLRNGDMLGELGFLDGNPHSAGLRVIGTCIAYSLSRSDFETFIEEDPDLMYKVMRAIIRTVHAILCDMNRSHIEMSNYIYKQHGRY